MTEDLPNLPDITGFHRVTNILSDVPYYDHVRDTCDQIYDILVDHCGPYATDALIIQENDSRNLKDPYYDIFTKDGIGIVRAIEFSSPIQKHIQYLIAYIGSRVDALSHDGTTTAMMFFTGLLKSYYAALIDEPNLDRKALVTDFRSALSLLRDTLETSVITIDRLVEDFGISRLQAIRWIAFHQAMIASKGDRELSLAIVEVVETLPKEMYGLFLHTQSRIETDKRFTVKRDDFDFCLSVVSNLDDMNHHLNTEYLAENCDLIVSEDDLIQGNPGLQIIERHLKAIGDMTRDLVIVTKSIDAGLQQAISRINRSCKYKVIVFTCSLVKSYSSRVPMLSAVAAVASVYPLYEHIIDPSKPYLIKDAKVHYHHKRLFLSNLYPKDGSDYHPSFTDPTRFEPYTEIVGDIRKDLEDFRSGNRRIETASDLAMYEDFTEIYRRLIGSDVRTLEISGMRHDTLSGRDVLQDAYGAVCSSLDTGFVLDGYLKFYRAVTQNETLDLDTRARFAGIIHHVLWAVHRNERSQTGPHEDVSSRNRPRNLVNTESDQGEGHNVDVTGQVVDDVGRSAPLPRRLNAAISYPDTSPYLYYPVGCDPTDDLGFEMDFTDETAPGVTPILQSADTFRELFRRLEDLLPKLIVTNRAIIPGTVNAGTSK